jgi:CheY-like chemotaxis protein
LQGRGPRLVLLDINLQTELNGFDFLTLMRGHPQGRLVPVIMISASQGQDKIEEAYRRGANAVTVKPFTYQEWKSYTSQLRTYWFETVTTPKLWFENEADK